MCKAQRSRTTFGSWDVKKSARRCGTKHVQGKMCKHHMLGQLWTFRCRFAGQAQGIVHLVTVSKTWGFSSISKNDGRRVTCEEDLERSIFRGRGNNTRDMLIRDVRRSGRWFPERSWILEHQIVRFGKVILCDKCSTSYDLASLFRGRCNILDTSAGKIAKCIGTRPSALHSTFYFWTKSRRIASANCFIFDVVNLKNWRSLAGLLRFWCCQIQKCEEVSQNSSIALAE